MEWLEALDRELFLFLNGLHTDWLDPIMLALTGKLIWLPFYLFLIFLLAKEYRWKTLWLLLGVAIGITISDQLVSGFMKPFFERLRPSRDPSMEGLVHMVNGYTGGRFSFASSHASNSFFTATFIFLCLKGRYKYISLVFAWAILFSYTRIYLGVHYPLDILTGALIGTLIGILIYGLLQKFYFKKIAASPELDPLK